MKTQRPLPKLRRPRMAMLAVGFAVLSGVCLFWGAREDSSTPFLLIGAGLMAVLVSLYYRRRCPQCGRRMRFRAEPLHPESYRHRMLFDCKHCEIVWDSGEIQEESLG